MSGRAASVWKQATSLADRAIGPRVAEFTRSEDFAILVALRARLEALAIGQTQRLSRRVLRVFDLPARTEQNRILSQLGSLEREIRLLRKDLLEES